ncbi:MAG: CinA family protein [Candidatus Omnitrophota bacterium]
MDELLKLAEEVGDLLRAKDLTLGLAESCTGGLLGAVITEIPGSSEYFRGSIVAYHNKVKKKVLKVPGTFLRKFGAVSPEVASAMARGARKATGAGIGLSVTGIAGPSGGSPEKPVGLVYIGLDAKRVQQVHKFNFSGTRSEIRQSACTQALRLLQEFFS